MFRELIEKEYLATFKSKFENTEDLEALYSALGKVSEKFKSELDGADWMSSSYEPNNVDILCFGIFERLVMLKKTPWHKAYLKLDIPDNLF